MARSKPKKPKKDNGGIPALFGVWLVAIAAAVACFFFLPASGESPTSPTYGLNRAIIILTLAGLAVLDSLVAAIKTFRRRRGLTIKTKSLGYTPFIFTTGSIGTVLQQLFSE